MRGRDHGNVVRGARQLAGLAIAGAGLALGPTPGAGQTLEDAHQLARTGDYRAAIRAYRRLAEEGGAHRIELCSDLSVEGLTPDDALLREVRATCALPVMCMVRPRAGGFSYDEEELRVMETSIERALDGGADGIVVGALRRDGSIDALAMERDAAGRIVSLAWRVEASRADTVD